MLREFEKARQEREGYRRLFVDEEFSLYVWYRGQGGELLGFQLTYFAGEEQKALTWREGLGYSHDGVDGWDSSRFNKTPLLVADGSFDRDGVARRFRAAAGELDREIRQLVLTKIAECGGIRLG